MTSPRFAWAGTLTIARAALAWVGTLTAAPAI
jgi:hypothetical protein